MDFKRNRRLRITPSIRSLVRETNLSVNDFVLPIFVVEGKGKKEPIPAMPGIYRYSLDLLKEEIKKIYSLGIKAVNIYTKIDNNLKDNTGKEACNPNGLMQNAIKLIKDSEPNIIAMPDVALDPYSIYGHDGIIKNGQIENDSTLKALVNMSISHAEAGADFVAPSDMMDGRVLAIRNALDQNSFTNVGILSYSAKYASAFYGPFRTALDSEPVDNETVPKDKKTYQMDFANSREAIREVLDDINEGVDIVMIKPGMPCLDIVAKVRETITQPIAVYQVSGEYAMLKAASQNGWLDNDKVMIESLHSIKRAGADLIFTYFAKEAAKLLN